MQRRTTREWFACAVAVSSLAATLFLATSVGAVAGAPSAPRGVRASGTATSIKVRWRRPSSIGTSALRGYVVTSRPPAGRCATRRTNCVVRGLHPGRSYTFRVVATNGAGASVAATSNRVKVAKVVKYFVSALAKFRSTTSAAQTAIQDATSTAAQSVALNKLRDAFAAFTSALTEEKWPSKLRVDMGRFIADTRSLGTDTAKSLESSPSATAQDLDEQQGATNSEVLAEASVYRGLGLSTGVVASIANHPTPVTLTTPVTVHDFFDDPLTVTATQVVDPATAASSVTPNTGDRFLAVEVSLADGSSDESVSGDANYSMTVTGSDGNTYVANFATVSECSNFNDGYFDVSPSESSATGCVVFELPTSVTVQTIQFSLAPGYLDTAAWDG